MTRTTRTTTGVIVEERCRWVPHEGELVYLPGCDSAAMSGPLDCCCIDYSLPAAVTINRLREECEEWGNRCDALAADLAGAKRKQGALNRKYWAVERELRLALQALRVKP